MEEILDNVLNFFWMFGVAVLVLFGAGFWLFYRLKKAAAEQDKLESESRPD